MSNRSPSHPDRVDAYEQSEKATNAMHSASLMLIAIQKLVSEGMETGGGTNQTKLFEVIDQLVEVTSNFITEALDVTGKVTFAVSGADQR